MEGLRVYKHLLHKKRKYIKGIRKRVKPTTTLHPIRGDDMNPYKITKKPEYDFNDPDDFRKLEKLAYDCNIDIDDFPPAAYRYFDKLRTLYQEYKFNGLLKKEATQRKEKLYSDYVTATKAYKEWCSVYKAYQDNIRKASTLLSDIEKEKDIVKAAFLAFDAIGRMTGDENFAKRQSKKWEINYDY